MTDQNEFQREVMQSLGRIEQKVDDVKERALDNRDYIVKTSARVGVLERAESRRKGVAATIAAAVSAAIALLTALIKGAFTGPGG